MDDGHSLILIKHKGSNNIYTKPTKAGKNMADDRLGEVQDRKKVRPVRLTHNTIV